MLFDFEVARRVRMCVVASRTGYCMARVPCVSPTVSVTRVCRASGPGARAKLRAKHAAWGLPLAAWGLGARHVLSFNDQI